MADRDDDIPFLQDALKETQATIRAYDIKAQIVGVGYIFAINIVIGLGRRIDQPMVIDSIVVAGSWILFILPVCLFGAVLYPTRKVAPKPGDQPRELERLFYVQPERFSGVDDYRERMDRSDLRSELIHEILTTAGLRDLKRRRFLRALWAAGISFLVIFAGQMARSAHIG